MEHFDCCTGFVGSGIVGLDIDRYCCNLDHILVGNCFHKSTDLESRTVRMVLLAGSNCCIRCYTEVDHIASFL